MAHPRTQWLVAFSLGLVGCGDPVPESPSFTADIQPILVANCGRCHSSPARGGAPQTFRLDVIDFTVRDDGTVLLGAGAMSEFVHERTHAGEMPPRFPLSDEQRDMLAAWHRGASPDTGALAGTPRASNIEPTVELVGEPAVTDGFVSFELQIGDADRDVVTGELYAVRDGMRTRITRQLGNGRARISWDTGRVAEGQYEIVASLADGITTVDRTVASYDVDRDGGNTAPTVGFQTVVRDALWTDQRSPVEIVVAVDDVDVGDTLSLSLEAFAGDEVVALAVVADAVRDDNAVPIDVSMLGAGTRWRLRARVSDGAIEREVVAGPFIVGRGTTSLGFEEVRWILAGNCGPCHPGTAEVSRVPGVTFALQEYDDVVALAGNIYRRAVDERNMPPASAAALVGVTLSDEDRAKLGEWLLAGAPE